MASSPEEEEPRLSPEPVDSPSPDPTFPLPQSPTGLSTANRSPASRRPGAPPGLASSMTTSSTPLGALNAARRPNMPAATLSATGGGLTQDLQEKMRNFHLARQGAPRLQPTASSGGGSTPSGPQVLSPTGSAMAAGGIPNNLKLPPGVMRPPNQHLQSSPAVPGGQKLSLAQKRGLALPGGLPGGLSPQPTSPVTGGPGRKKPGLSLSQMNHGAGPDGNSNSNQSQSGGSMLDKYSEYIDKKTGSLTFKDKAVISSKGIEFSGGQVFNISLDEIETLDELGKGNYGTVYKVRHSKPQMRRPGLGLAGNKVAQPTYSAPVIPTSPNAGQGDFVEPSTVAPARGNTTGVVMAMKEMRLELEDAKFATIIMELDILHRCISPFIVDFYGAFFQEGAVYICMEFMDGGSIDKLYGGGIPEGVLRKITLSTAMGLKSLKDDHNIIHRDVKPTNILVNSRGQVKICDFGVSGNLVASIAKTNIGCQSYMAPERISSGGMAQAGAGPGAGTYSVQSDIWSLGLTIIECALGRYPYPPETYNNIFSQLSAIVDGEPPDLPADDYSPAAHDFVHGCLNKIPKLRPTYAMLLQHAWLAPLLKPPTIAEEEEPATPLETDPTVNAQSANPPAPPTTEDKEVAEWVLQQLEKKRLGTYSKGGQKPALHQAPLDAVGSPGA